MRPSGIKELPPEAVRRKIEEQAGSITDPVQKLRYIHQALDAYRKEHFSAGSGHRETGNILTVPRRGAGIPAAGKKFILLQPGRHASSRENGIRMLVLVCLAGLMLILLISREVVVFPFYRFSADSQGKPQRPVPEVTAFHPIPPPLPKVKTVLDIQPLPRTEIAEQPVTASGVPTYLDKLIWMVDQNETAEYFSNRLKIVTTQTTDNIPRSYYLYPKGSDGSIGNPEISSRITGILYHASEGDVFAYRPEMTQSIKEYSRLLVRYLKKRKAYHYFIDRFGTVYRLVREDHAAFHSGNAIWADKDHLYLDLNHAFIGICFEGKDFENRNSSDTRKSGKKGPAWVPMEQSSITEAQLISGKELTDWLRVKYKIAQNNCIPHGLASVNPYDQLIGHHLDLSHGFPFALYEISNKYLEPIPAITLFGFTYDNYFSEIFEGRLWPGIEVSERILRERASSRKMTVAAYRESLNRRFAEIFSRLKELNRQRNERFKQSSIKTKTRG